MKEENIMTVQERSEGYQKWIADSDIFDIDIWWDPTFDQGFVTYQDFEKQMADYKAFGITGGIITAKASATHDGYVGNAELAELLNLEFVDMWTPSKDGQWYFYDGLHPQGEVYGQVGEAVYNGIKDTIKKPE